MEAEAMRLADLLAEMPEPNPSARLKPEPGDWVQAVPPASPDEAGFLFPWELKDTTAPTQAISVPAPVPAEAPVFAADSACSRSPKPSTICKAPDSSAALPARLSSLAAIKLSSPRDICAAPARALPAASILACRDAFLGLDFSSADFSPEGHRTILISYCLTRQQ